MFESAAETTMKKKRRVRSNTTIESNRKLTAIQQHGDRKDDSLIKQQKMLRDFLSSARTHEVGAKVDSLTSVDASFDATTKNGSPPIQSILNTPSTRKRKRSAIVLRERHDTNVPDNASPILTRSARSKKTQQILQPPTELSAHSQKPPDDNNITVAKSNIDVSTPSLGHAPSAPSHPLITYPFSHASGNSSVADMQQIHIFNLVYLSNAAHSPERKIDIGLFRIGKLACQPMRYLLRAIPRPHHFKSAAPMPQHSDTHDEHVQSLEATEQWYFRHHTQTKWTSFHPWISEIMERHFALPEHEFAPNVPQTPKSFNGIVMQMDVSHSSSLNCHTVGAPPLRHILHLNDMRMSSYFQNHRSDCYLRRSCQLGVAPPRNPRA